MSQGLIVAGAIAVGLACPAHMWWSHRRGRGAACCPGDRTTHDTDEIEALCTRQQRLRAMIAEHQGSSEDTVSRETASS